MVHDRRNLLVGSRDTLTEQELVLFVVVSKHMKQEVWHWVAVELSMLLAWAVAQLSAGDYEQQVLDVVHLAHLLVLFLLAEMNDGDGLVHPLLVLLAVAPCQQDVDRLLYILLAVLPS